MSLKFDQIRLLVSMATDRSSQEFEIWPDRTTGCGVFSALKGTHFYILFVVTAAGVVLCGSPKKQPRTSSIVQFILFFWSFKISEIL